MSQTKTQDLDRRIADVKSQRLQVQQRIADVKAQLAQFEQSSPAKDQTFGQTDASGRQRRIAEYLAELKRMLPAGKRVIIVADKRSQQGTRSQIAMTRPASTSAVSRNSGVMCNASVENAIEASGDGRSAPGKSRYGALQDAIDLSVFTIEIQSATEYAASKVLYCLEEEVIDYRDFQGEQKEEEDFSIGGAAQRTEPFGERIEDLIDYRAADAMGDVADYDQDNEIMLL